MHGTINIKFYITIIQITTDPCNKPVSTSHGTGSVRSESKGKFIHVKPPAKRQLDPTTYFYHRT